MDIISKTKVWISIFGIVVITSIVFLAIWGLKLGIDFTGGSLLEVRYLSAQGGERPSVQEVQKQLSGLGLGNITVQPVGESNLILRFKDISEEKHQKILRILNNVQKENKATSTKASVGEKNKVQVEAEGEGGLTVEEIETSGYEPVVEELRFDTIGPSIGRELKIKSIYAIIIVLILIIAYIAWSFRKISKPVASWKYGLVAVIALFHDILIVMGTFALLGKFLDIEVDTAFIAALLTVLGYSINDTIVVFDRIRENLPRSEEDFAGTVNTSINQTLGRSINTTLTTLVALSAIFLFGGDTTRYFALALIIGIASGAYSSIFVASPLLVVWEKMKK